MHMTPNLIKILIDTSEYNQRIIGVMNIGHTIKCTDITTIGIDTLIIDTICEEIGIDIITMIVAEDIITDIIIIIIKN